MYAGLGKIWAATKITKTKRQIIKESGEPCMRTNWLVSSCVPKCRSRNKIDN